MCGWATFKDINLAVTKTLQHFRHFLIPAKTMNVRQAVDMLLVEADKIKPLLPSKIWQLTIGTPYNY